MIIKLYKASFIVHYHCSILTRDYLLMHCNCKSWSPPHGSPNNLISFGHYMFWGGMYCHLFSCRGNGLSSFSSLQSFPQTLEMSGGRFVYGLWATHLKPTLQITLMCPGSQQGSGIPQYKQPGQLKTCSGT